MQAMEACVDELDRHGMEAWLYDENNWPSGTYGGILTRENPEFRMRYLRIQAMQVSGGATFQTTLDADDNTLLCAQAVRLSNTSHGTVEGEIRDVTDRCTGGKMRWEVPSGEWLVTLFWECPVAAKTTWFDGYYLDTMNEEAVAAFRRLAYDPYDRLSEHFGTVVKGVFTDEPGLMVHDAFFKVQAMRATVEQPDRVLPGMVIAWTRDFETKFRDRYGYDIRPHLLSLAYDIGPETNKIRADYFEAVSHWYATNYHGMLSEWCRKRNLEFIGHTLEEPLFNQVRTQGNQTWVLSHMDRPGLDYLGHGVGTAENSFRILAAKCAASAAHTQGKQRVMCEAFGASGHGHTLADRRLDANFMAALGVNMIIPHAFYYSFEGYRKIDSPPTEFYHAPFWPLYKTFADYLGRLCMIQSSGRHIADIAILAPIKTMYTHMIQNGQAVREPECQKLHEQLSELLLALHHDYDYIDDSQFAEANTENGRLAFAASEESYPLVILPAVQVISLQAAQKLEEFYNSGGAIIALGDLPSEADRRGDDDEVIAVISRIFGVANGDGERRNASAAGGRAVCVSPENLREWLQANIPELIESDVRVTDENGEPLAEVVCCHRTGPQMDTFLLVNRTKTPQSAFLTLKTAGGVEEWSLETGEREPLAVLEGENNQRTVQLDLEGAEARVVVVGSGITEETITDLPMPELTDQLFLTPKWQFEALGGNVAILDQWQFTARDLRAGVKERCPHMVNSYSTSFEIDGQIGPVKLVVDDLKQWIPAHSGFLAGIRSLEIHVNDQRAAPLVPAKWQDPDYMWTDISNHLKTGTNTIAIHTISLLEPMDAMREPVYLVGDFAVKDGVLMPSPRMIEGYFSDSGFPHFPGPGVYRQTVDIPARYLRDYRLVLDLGEVRDCCRVILNEKEAGTAIWSPFHFDITKLAKAGRNELVVEVAGNLGNLYDKTTREAGLAGPVVIWIFS